MGEPTEEVQGPTYFANIVTSQFNVDELTLEFRRFIPSHRKLSLKSGVQIQSVPPPSPQEVMEQEPVARVVLTFTAAKSLKEYLDQTIAKVESARKAGQVNV